MPMMLFMRKVGDNFMPDLDVIVKVVEAADRIPIYDWRWLA